MQEGNCDFANCPYIREITEKKDEELRRAEADSEERMNEIRRLRSVIGELEKENRTLEKRLISAGLSNIVFSSGSVTA